jgi:hypothetical protein
MGVLRLNESLNPDRNYFINELLQNYINAAISYAESYQKKPEHFYSENIISPTPEQAIIMLVSYFYESRDGGTGGFFQIMFRPVSKFGIQSTRF